MVEHNLDVNGETNLRGRLKPNLQFDLKLMQDYLKLH